MVVVLFLILGGMNRLRVVHSLLNHGSFRSSRWIPQRDTATYLWVELVDPCDRLFHLAALDRAPDVHPVLDRFKVDGRRQAGFPSKVLRRFSVAFDDEVVHHEPVQVTTRPGKKQNVSERSRGVFEGQECQGRK